MALDTQTVRAKEHVRLGHSGPRLKQAAGTQIVNEYDQEIPQSQTADNPVAP